MTLPIGPQLQAMWRSPESATKLQDQLRCTAENLAARHSDAGITGFDDICCGSEYLDHIEQGKICDDNMIISISIDGAQLYQSKKSDAWFGIAQVLDLPPELRHRKLYVLPLFIIGGPNAPKHYESFLFSTFHHLSACQ